VAFVGTTSRPPKWIKPQLTRLVDEAPTGKDWLHEIKYDGYRMHARIDGSKITLLTRTLTGRIDTAGQSTRLARSG
jgi:ATP-dependent DNA ligase